MVDDDLLAHHTDLYKQYLDSCTLGYHKLVVVVVVVVVAGVEVDVAFDSLFDTGVVVVVVVVVVRKRRVPLMESFGAYLRSR